MKILELHLQHFGQFKDKHLELEDGINLISGDNESGKSTVHTFIRSMFFGLQRLRGRASRKDDYSKYSPWEDPAFYAGSMRMASEGKCYRLNRNFYRRENTADLYCETTGKKLSVENGDLQELLGGVSQGIYENTLCIGQLMAAPYGSLADELEKNFTNELHSLDETVDVAAALKQLSTQEKNLQKKKRDLQLKKETLRSAQRMQLDYLREEAEENSEELAGLEEQLEEKKQALQNFRMEKKVWEENEERSMQEERRQMRTTAQQGNKPVVRSVDLREKDRQARRSALEMIFLSLVVVAVLLGTARSLMLDGLMMKWIVFLAIAAIALSVIGAVRLVLISSRERKRMEAAGRKKDVAEAAKDAGRISTQAEQAAWEIPEEGGVKTGHTAENDQGPLSSRSQQALDEQAARDEDRKHRWQQMQERERLLQENLYKLNWKQDELQEVLSEKQRIIANREEDLEEMPVDEEEQFLDQEIQALGLAMKTLQQLSEEIRLQVGSGLRRNMSMILNDITDGTYLSLRLDEDELPELYDGERTIPLFRVSQGTAEQAWFSLRMAAADLLCKEVKLPIMLDDTFAMYDDERLGRTLEYLAGRNQQVLLFSCTHREEQMMEKLGIPFHKVNLY